MQQLNTIEKPTFNLPNFQPGELDYTAQAHTDEMYAFVHLFRQQCPSFGLPVTYALNSFYLKRYPYGKTGSRQKEKGQQLLDELLVRFSEALETVGWTQIGVSPNNGKTPIWQPPREEKRHSPLCYNRPTLTAMPIQERPRPADVRFFSAYAEELREAFRRGFLSELLPYPQFVVWKNQVSDGKPHKPPYSPVYHRRADTSDPASWGTLDQALQALGTGAYNGIGFVFSPADPNAGIDLDHCVGTNRSINQREREIIDFLSTHTHYSPRDGVHILFEIDKARFPGHNQKAGNLEFFQSNHYLTLTPNRVPGTPAAIAKRQVEAAYVYLSVFPRQPRPPDRNTRGDERGRPLWTPQPKLAEPSLPEKPDDLVIHDALNEERSNFSRYWQGDPSLWTSSIPGVQPERSSPSEVFFVLLAMLLTRTGDNQEQTKRLYRLSPFAQSYPKAEQFIGTDRQTGRRVTYLESTIRNVLEKRRQPPHR